MTDTTFSQAVADAGYKDIHLGLFDLNSEFRHKMVDAAKAVKLAEKGYAFCEVIHAWDSAERTWQADRPYIDLPAQIFPDTLRQWPFGPNAGVAIADFTGDFGQKSPRNQALRQIARAAEMDLHVTAAFEFEFFLLDETADTLRAKGWRNLNHFAKANRTYSLQSAAAYGEMFDDLRATMNRLGIGLDSLHTELGPGCFEAPLAAVSGIRAADDAALFKNFAKAFFARRDLTAVFMSKLDPSLSGQSGHFHISLQDSAGNPVFADPTAPDGLSHKGRHFLGGLIRLMPELLLLTAHRVNAYKRMVPGAWAPTWASWGVQNRTAAVRIINDSPEATRIEYRVPSADTNPHATMAMCLAAGLWGIEHAIEPPPALQASAYSVTPTPEQRFPRDLIEAAQRLEASDTARSLFGTAFVDHMVEASRFEAADYLRQVTPWELQRYLELP
ncbi:glutamine synthetase family protein [Cypionkella sinensis]|uniref:Glutamine synthetase family protein n=1 Tax=Cypionkella sinensis TaxID=1756043 RepID=A0ABV7JAM6_9RHOB